MKLPARLNAVSTAMKSLSLFGHRLAAITISLASVATIASLSVPLFAAETLEPAGRSSTRGRATVSELEDAYRSRKTKLGADNTNTLSAMRSLASAYVSAGQQTNALPLLQECLALATKRYGSNHSATLSAVHTLAQYHLVVGQPAEARPLFEQAYTVRETVFGTNDVSTLKSLTGVVQSSMALKQYTNAEAPARTLVARGRTLDPEKWNSGEDLLLLGECVLRQERFAEAEVVLRECVKILEREYPGLSPTFTAQTYLGWSLVGQKKYAEAESFMVKPYEGLVRRQSQRPDPSRVSLIKEAGERIHTLYEEWGKSQQAEAWRKKLANPAEASP